MTTEDPELAQLREFEQAEREAGLTPSPDPTAGAPGPGGGAKSRLDQLQQLADLHDRGVLNDDEFAAEKAKILSEG